MNEAMVIDQQQPLSLEKAGNQEDLLARFIAFIDAAPNTVRTYTTSLKQWFKYLYDYQVQNPTPETVRQYRHQLAMDGKKPTTIQNYIVAVKQFFKWTEEEGLYPDIAKHVKGAKISTEHKKDYLTSSQARQVLTLLSEDQSLKGKRDYAMLALMLTMGLRTVEVSRANIEDIRTEGDSTVLYVQGKGHIEKDAIVRMPNHVEGAIRAYLQARDVSDGSAPLFASVSHQNNGQRMTTRSISGIVKQSFIQAGYNSPRLTAHSTRHTAATLNLLNGATLEETQQLLRHVNLQTTEIYAHHLQAAKNKSSQRVDNAIFGS
ncbi:tyrosine-type recombinase/integrase [Limosilactobacillus mucosae]|jgi:integrase/recombinase XerD|uniref:tyrosine-type recombinase/integrase n=1 Tax=Limosilactobacillus mucosae TaxID=97478 RepID=UPI00233F1ED6|nr:tyrosine-type recombinase/integrase [Limosilactobacillus mucosae]MDC2844954.1 tyrosine-type recombinase/integrase [Limosilactobacillus mucosae]